MHEERVRTAVKAAGCEVSAVSIAELMERRRSEAQVAVAV